MFHLYRQFSLQCLSSVSVKYFEMMMRSLNRKNKRGNYIGLMLLLQNSGNKIFAGIIEVPRRVRTKNDFHSEEQKMLLCREFEAG